MVGLVAEPNPGWTVNGWAGGASGSGNPKGGVAARLKVGWGVFLGGASLQIDSWGGGVSTEPSMGRFPIGTPVTLHANPAVGFTFDSFVIGGVKVAENPTMIVVTNNMVINARFNSTTVTPLWQHSFTGVYF